MPDMRSLLSAFCFLLSVAAYGWIPYVWITLSSHVGGMSLALHEMYVEGGFWFLRMNYLFTALSVMLGTTFFIAGVHLAARPAAPR